MRVAAVGVVVGVVGAVAGFRVLRSLATGVQAADVGLAGGAAVVLAVAMVAAAYVPARRAGRVNLVDALRAD